MLAFRSSLFSVGRHTISVSTRLFKMSSSHVRATGYGEKISSPAFKTIFTQELRMLAEVFERHNHEIRIAGGAVRDLLMDKVPADVDFATTATPDEMKAMFETEGIRMLNNKGEKHGTVTARIMDSVNFEVTTLRQDVVTDGRHAEVRFTKDWVIDAERRDLTVNSMFLDLEGRLYDFFGGRKDLGNRRVAFVGDASARIQEDYLRILRYFRFYGRIAKDATSHEQHTLDAIGRNVGGMALISGERIWSELKKIIAGRFPQDIVGTMVQVGLSPYIGLPKEPNVEELARVMDRGCFPGEEKPLPPTCCAALLRSEEEMLALHSRLKMSGFERDLGLFVVQHRGDGDCSLINGTSNEEETINMYKCLVVDAKVRPCSTVDYVAEVIKYRGEKDLFATWKRTDIPKMPVAGKDLKDAGCPPGRIYSAILSLLKERWKKSNFQLTKEQLLEMLPEVMDDISRRRTGIT